jgi:hypothetical protein
VNSAEDPAPGLPGHRSKESRGASPVQAGRFAAVARCLFAVRGSSLV